MTSPVLIITRGLPGSGKTTWARQQRGFRVNRDDIRTMLVPVWPHGDPAHERLCTILQLAQIEALLRMRFDVISDDTNLRRSHVALLTETAARYRAKVVIRDFTDVPVQTCIDRDAARPTPVGAANIRRMWTTYQTETALNTSTDGGAR